MKKYWAVIITILYTSHLSSMDSQYQDALLTHDSEDILPVVATVSAGHIVHKAPLGYEAPPIGTVIGKQDQPSSIAQNAMVADTAAPLNSDNLAPRTNNTVASLSSDAVNQGQQDTAQRSWCWLFCNCCYRQTHHH